MSGRVDAGGGLTRAVAVLAWVWVLVPFAYGLYFLVLRIPALFSG
jgi:hypothetical protein